MNRYRAWFAGLLLPLLLVGCAAIGLPAPETFNQKLVLAYSTVTAVRTTNIALLDADIITADDGANVAKAADAARAGIDVARQLSKTDVAAADAKLTAVRSALAALQVYLTARGK